jgi:hypothetical protein
MEIALLREPLGHAEAIADSFEGPERRHEKSIADTKGRNRTHGWYKNCREISPGERRNHQLRVF